MSNRKPLRINFVMSPSPKITGGPLAIVEYANRLAERGHQVSITTAPDIFWEGLNPFPWAKINGAIHYLKLRHDYSVANSQSLIKQFMKRVKAKIIRELLKRIPPKFLDNRFNILYAAPSNLANIGIDDELQVYLRNVGIAKAIPDCDINIATYWETAYPVFWSKKGRPVYFIQHLEQVFFDSKDAGAVKRIGVDASYRLPIYKIANSSWLQSQIKKRYGIDVPFTNNGIDLNDFSPMPKLSSKDKVIRIIIYSRPEQWKGFQDAMNAMRYIKEKYKDKVELHVFGYANPAFPPENIYFPYTFHQGLSFKQLSALYATSDIALCPSWYESFPLPPLEAMASGTAVITTEYGTEDYALHNKTALVVKPRVLSEMISAVESLIEQPELRERLVKNGLEMAKEFAWENIVPKREELLYQVMDASPRQLWETHNLIDIMDGNNVDFDFNQVNLGLREGEIITNKRTGQVFYVSKGCIQYIASPQAFDACGFSQSEIREVDELLFQQLREANPIFSKEDIYS